MIMGEDYIFRDDMKEYDTVPIEMLTGPFKGVILRYTQVGVKELEDGTAKLRFQYELYEMGDFTETALRKDHKFEQHAGLILNSLILESVEAPDATGKDDLTEFVEE